ncbi:MAG TPA: bacteriocin-protection protein [Blastocatellia bacterium]|nr:bacteriocin-protection protein [Blastocatellia bacterium]
MPPKFFKSPSDFRKWLAAHHANAKELLVGFYKKDTGKQSITWPESVDEALCFGWIDGIRRRIDDDSYSIRFTPRKTSSTWSAVNIARAKELSREGRMAAAGENAFVARKENRSGIYSYEQRSAELIEPYAGKLRRNKAAAKFFASQPPSYRKAANWWVISAKQEETRLRRLEKLISLSAAGQTIPQFTRLPKQ